jgi:hypothetical protein
VILEKLAKVSNKIVKVVENFAQEKQKNLKYGGGGTSSRNFQLSSLTNSQILAKFSCGWSPSPVHRPHKIVRKYYLKYLK